MTPYYYATGSAAADNAIVFEVPDNADKYDTWILGSTGGAMDVFISGAPTTYQTAALALVDLGSTSPSTAVISTTAGGIYGIKGRFPMIKVLQNGATAVAGAFLIGYSS